LAECKKGRTEETVHWAKWRTSNDEPQALLSFQSWTSKKKSQQLSNIVKFNPDFISTAARLDAERLAKLDDTLLANITFSFLLPPVTAPMTYSLTSITEDSM